MFWFFMYLLARPRYPRRITVNHVRWKYPRFHSPWYWLSMLAVLELIFWLAVLEIAGEGFLLWWTLWLPVRYITGWAAGRNRQQWTVPRWLEASRPVWPKRAEAATAS